MPWRAVKELEKSLLGGRKSSGADFFRVRIDFQIISSAHRSRQGFPEIFLIF
jgi:hypothetical protein